MRTIESVKDLSYSDLSQTNIKMTVKFAEFDFELPILATAGDATTWGKQLYDGALAGEYGDIAAYDLITPAPTTAALEAAATKQALKDSAIAKLVALGLTEAEALSLI